MSKKLKKTIAYGGLVMVINSIILFLLKYPNTFEISFCAGTWAGVSYFKVFSECQEGRHL